jgi:Rod binding domain-containing protein
MLAGALTPNQFSREAPAAARVPGSREAKAWGNAQEFEGVFLNTMFSQMFAGLGDDDTGPMGGKKTEAWRGLLTDEYAKSVAAQGGIGLAPQIYRELLANQEAASRAATAMRSNAAATATALRAAGATP